MTKKDAPSTAGTKPQKDTLSLEDTVSARARVLYPTKVKASGQNPYEIPGSARPLKSSKPPTDLRELSKWIKARREVEEAKKASNKTDPDKKSK